MDLLRMIGNVVFHIFYRMELALDDQFFAERAQGAEMIVVAMRFRIEGPDGH